MKFYSRVNFFILYFKIRANKNYSSCFFFNLEVMPKDEVPCITQDYLNRAKSSFELGYSDIFGPAPKFDTRNTLIFKAKPQEPVVKKVEVLEQSFHPSSSISAYKMPHDELKLYAKQNWSYKNVALPRNSSLNNTFDGFNKSRSNYMEPKA